ncbi:BnaA09g40370D [Brassica napus]|uniref:(rape) hypothetical protein n=1 Tax=Brassica napus TaxID=3708 RepID=A0A078FDT5_BRANA|nr:uncharacterized protein LOC111200374 [Brassica napus]CAF2049272.1 unnamed protein product [Brassica napus]CDY11471.1 BnaA09g40370D [Brassica napus]
MEEYSASATTVSFDRPKPLLRGPIPAGGSESGQYVLAFRSLDSWAAAYKRCEAQIKEQCEEGARIGCAVSASNNCKPPWWRSLGGAVVDMREREKCEEREFKECLVAAKDKCSGFAKEKCSAAFLDARIAVETEVEGLVWLASLPEDSSRWLGSLVQARCSKTNRRARDLLLKQQKQSHATY